MMQRSHARFLNGSAFLDTLSIEKDPLKNNLVRLKIL